MVVWIGSVFFVFFCFFCFFVFFGECPLPLCCSGICGWILTHRGGGGTFQIYFGIGEEFKLSWRTPRF